MKAAIIFLVAALFFVPLYAQVKTNISLGLSCPSGTPYLCPNSKCVSDLSQCPIDNCTGTTPYQCSDSSCAISSIYCNCIGVVCSDGSCKSDITLCPLLDTCPELFPRRCPDGSCDVWNSTCANHTGPNCPTGLQLCLDGICRTPTLCDTLPFQGCPLFECADGTCTNSYSNCLCPTDSTKVLCCDGSCVPIETPCAVTAPAFISPMNVTLTLDPSLSNVLVVPTSSNFSTKVVAITLPSGSVNSVQTQNGTINTVTVQGVSSLQTINSSILTQNGNATIAKILSVPVNVNFGNGQSIVNSPVTVTFPTVNTNENSMCVAVLENGVWTCVNNSVTQQLSPTSFSVTANVSHFSTYAVVKKPSCYPAGNVPGPQFCAQQSWPQGTIGYFCANNGKSFYMCLGTGFEALDNIQNCARGTSCTCCEGEECSNYNTESPCR